MATHRPSKKQTVLFFLFSLLLAAGVIAWTFFLNTGTLAVEGKAPFTLRVSGREVICPVSPCAVQIAPGAYDMTLQKDGFFETRQRVVIRRWKETPVQARFEFIPVVRFVGKLVLPLETAPLKAPFLGMEKFENFPKGVSEAVFSPSGNLALLKLGRERYLYDVGERMVTLLPLSFSTPAAWIGEKIVSLEDADGKQTLVLRAAGQREEVVAFARPLSKPLLLGSPSGKKLLIQDAGTRALYMVDVEKRTRRRMDGLESDATADHWTGEVAVISQRGRISVVDPDTFEKIELPATDAKNVVALEAEVLAFFSRTKRDSGKTSSTQTLQEAFEAAKEETLTGKSSETGLFLIRFSLKDRLFKTLAEIPVADGAWEKVYPLTFDPASGNLRFVKNGGLFEILLKP